MLIVTYDNSDKDVPCICVMKVGESLSYACLKMELGEQAELLYRALTEQDFRIKENKRDTLVGKDVLVGFKQGVDSIRALPSVTPQEPRWIPVSERYPQIEDEYKYFLVTDDKGKVSVQEFFISLDEEPQPYFSGMVNVIAWMPLPQPYREVEE